MDTPTFVDTLNPEFPNPPSPLNTSSTGNDKRPAIRVLAGPIRLASYQQFPILLDASDPLVVGFYSHAAGFLADVRIFGSIARVRIAQ